MWYNIYVIEISQYYKIHIKRGTYYYGNKQFHLTLR